MLSFRSELVSNIDNNENGKKKKKAVLAQEIFNKQ